MHIIRVTVVSIDLLAAVHISFLPYIFSSSRYFSICICSLENHHVPLSIAGRFYFLLLVTLDRCHCRLHMLLSCQIHLSCHLSSSCQLPRPKISSAHQLIWSLLRPASQSLILQTIPRSSRQIWSYESPCHQ